jgi:hypothetical protein
MHRTKLIVEDNLEGCLENQLDLHHLHVLTSEKH